ncbi:MAG: SGNH/GDSL hydrolase family protein [Saprospiraceae bacterium]|nr:SGNH/GDSL hydrolase family protein [Saprospiraceae bacterium]
MPCFTPLYISYLALGDSYTIGQSVPVDERFPAQLIDSLLPHHIMGSARVIAKTGWTTAELDAAIAAAQPPVGNSYDIVTLLIGVNNQYRGYPLDQYEVQFADLLEQAVIYAGSRPERVFVLSIPDYAYTPFGQNFNPTRISQEIDEFNAANKSISLARGVHYIDITPISREGLQDPALVASDQLHPSGKMYARWVSLLKHSVIAELR